MNILFCSVGRRAELLKDFRMTMGKEGRIVATDSSCTAPGLYFADKYYTVPLISDHKYLDEILRICQKENIRVITTCIDPEIAVLAQHRADFEKLGILVLVPDEKTAKICFDKYDMYCYLKKCGVPTVETYSNLDEFEKDYKKGKILFPVFVKPRTGSGSVGARKIETIEQLRTAIQEDPSIIIQEYMGDAEDIDVDVYVDAISHEMVSTFSKRKLEKRIGGASKTISFKDEALITFLQDALKYFAFYGPIDVDIFQRNGQYYLSEINPRFGGAYLHAYGAGVDFVRLIQNNVEGNINTPRFQEYEEGIAMMMYDSVVICRPADNNEP